VLFTVLEWEKKNMTIYTANYTKKKNNADANGFLLNFKIEKTPIWE
jgi:hypothetical protein